MVNLHFVFVPHNLAAIRTKKQDPEKALFLREVLVTIIVTSAHIIHVFLPLFFQDGAIKATSGRALHSFFTLHSYFHLFIGKMLGSPAATSFAG